VIPVLLLTGWAGLLAAGRSRTEARDLAFKTSEQVAQKVSAELGKELEIAQTLAASTSLDSGDLDRFYRTASRLVSSRPLWETVSLATPDGTQIVNLLRPLGASLSADADPRSLAEVIRTKSPAIGGIGGVGPLSGRRLVPLRVPVMRDGNLRYVLTIGLNPSQISGILRHAGAPDDWIGAIVDGSGKIVARTVAEEFEAGRLAAPSSLQAISGGRDGFYAGRTIEGLEMETVLRFLPRTEGWTVHFGIPVETLDGPIRRWIILLLAGGATSLALAFLLAMLIANDIAQRRRAAEERSRLALSQNQQVKQFAQRMIQDHTQAGERLKSAAQGQQIPTDLDQQHTETMQGLRNAKGPVFDRRYVQAQLTAHQDAVQLYEGFSRSAQDSQLKQFASQTLPTLREHLQMAQQLQQALPPDRVGAAGTPGEAGQAQEQGDPSRIVVQESAAQVRVDQAAPQVTVRQPQPDVTVRQPRPQITVRQPQPTVTIDIPQPEIIVRMPQPDVNVAMAQPQVQVRQPQPQVQVVQPREQPQVQVQRDQASVQVLKPQSQPDVQVQQAQGEPEVRYERAQPRVVVNQPQGQPKVTFEAMNSTQDQAGQNDQTAQNEQVGAAGQNRQASAATAATPAPAAQARSAQSAPTSMSAADRTDLRSRINAGDTETTGTVGAGAAAQTRAMAVSRLEYMNVYNAKGEDLGKVDRVLVDGQGRKFLVVGNGGFLGIGRDRAAFPMDRFWLRGDRLVIRGVTENDIESMDNYRSQSAGMRRVNGTEQADLRLWQ
jgi:predicted outer membrane protein/sporulation protein YlmC with PRC-barrel domain